MPRLTVTASRLRKQREKQQEVAEVLPLQYQTTVPKGTLADPHPDYVPRKRKLPTPEETEAHIQAQVAAMEGGSPESPKKQGQGPKEDPKAFARLDPSHIAAVAGQRVAQGRDRSTLTLKARVLAVLPTPHPKQLEIIRSTAKRKVINTGRRVGKTTVANFIGITMAVEGRRVLFASPSQDQVDTFWDNCKKWLDPFIQSGEITKNENRRILEFPSTGGRLRAKTASDADMLRGDYADFLVLDECAMLERKAWDEVGAPMLMDNDGDAWFLSTPKRRNWFYNLYIQAQNDLTGRMAYFHATSFDNPHLSPQALQEITRDLSQDSFRQEIMAEFLEGDGAVFRNITECLTAPTNPSREYHQSHFKVIGADWGQTADYTVFSCVCATCMQELELIRFNRVDWAIARERLISLHKRWGVAVILAESNAMSVLLETLRNEDHLPIEAFTTSAATKGPLIRALALSFERSDSTWLPDDAARLELEAFEGITSRVTGHTQYSGPKDGHDDTVIARALAYRAAMERNTVAAPSAIAYSQISVIQGQGATLYLPPGHFAPSMPSSIPFANPSLDPYNPLRGLK